MNTDRIALGAGIDPTGQLYRQGDEIRREISPGAQPLFRQLLAEGALMHELVGIGLVGTRVVEDSSARLVLRHDRIPRQTFWPEWSFDMLRDAALLTVRLTRRLLAGGRSLKDAHPYNVMFDGCRPVFVDFGSITPFTPRLPQAWARSFFVEFYLPLRCLRGGHRARARWLMAAENRPRLKIRLGHLAALFPEWQRAFPRGEFAASLAALETWLESARLDQFQTTWADYYARGNTPRVGVEETYTAKERAADRFLVDAHGRGARTLLDVASNEGWFTDLATRRGYDVVAFDYDDRAINALYRKLGPGCRSVLPAVMNYIAPTPRHGPDGAWPGAAERLRGDVVLAMAVIHHLALGQGMRFGEFAARLAEFSNRFAIVEFISPEDVHIRRRAARKPWYQAAAFHAAMGQRFRLLGEAGSEPDTRRVYFYERL